MPNEYIRKNWSGGSAGTTLSAGVTAGATSMTVTDGSLLPSSAYPFVAVIDRGLATEEKVLVLTRATNSLSSVQRGYDGTTAQAHSSGAAIEHCIDAYSIEQANAMAAAATAQYDMVYRNSSATDWARIAAGAEGHLLQISGGVPSFGALGTGSLADGIVTAAKLESDLPRGMLGYATTGTTQSSTGAESANIFTPFNVTVAAGRLLKITLWLDALGSSVDNDTTNVRIYFGGTNLTNATHHVVGANRSTSMVVVHAPAAGTFAVTARHVRASGSGTCYAGGTSATRLAYLMVEDVGAA